MTKTLTSEQTAVVASKANLLAVDAFAGTGKTSTLVEYATARPSKRILYIAFNKSVATEAKERFPQNVECRTTHSLAFGSVGRQYADKLGNPAPFEIAQRFNCNAKRAKHALQTISSWLCSTDTEVSEDHVDVEAVGADRPREIAAVVDLAQSVWAEMQNLRSATKMPHDGYLKLWVMSKPKLRYDIILLDEAQDTNPVTLELVLAQKAHASLVLVGDKHQGIYGFRKALNAMELVKADERIAITQSFRFAQGIADVATRLLRHFKGELLAVKGRDDLQASWQVDQSKHHAIIGRTNAGLFTEAARMVVCGQEPRIHFVGGFDSYLFGKVLDAYYLWSDQRQLIKDSTILNFTCFEHFRAYGQEVSDAEVKALVKVVEAYGTQVPDIYNAIKSAETIQARSTVTLTTAHKSKGLEWEQVYLADDFIELPPDDDDFDREEINLLYVAVTRAIRAVRLPQSLDLWLKSSADPATACGVAGESQGAAPTDNALELRKESREIKSVGDLKRFIADLPDDLPIGRATEGHHRINRIGEVSFFVGALPIGHTDEKRVILRIGA